MSKFSTIQPSRLSFFNFLFYESVSHVIYNFTPKASIVLFIYLTVSIFFLSIKE